jgi:hypothetical protein
MARPVAFRFGARRPRQRVVLRRLLSLAQRFLHEQIDDAAVLGVHADQPAVLARLPQRRKIVASSTMKTPGRP